MNTIKLGLIAGLACLLASSCNNSQPDETAAAPEVTTGFKPHFGETEANYYAANEVAGHIHQPNAKREFKWPEHPKGMIIQQTNNLGLKEDSDTQEAKAEGAVRVLVTGDSHTDGVIHNSESFPNVLEDSLNSNLYQVKYEFLNAGNGYYGPQNYLGSLKHYSNLKPDVFIVALYTGNDYMDAVRIEAENGRMQVPERPESYYYDLWDLDGKMPGFTGQLMNQVKFLKTYPAYRDTALNVTHRYLGKIKAYCDSVQIDFMVVLVPTKIDVEPELDSARIDTAYQIMKFTEADIKQNESLIDETIKWLSTQGVTYLDMREPLRNAEGELYWKADLHINHLGHAEIAKAILSNQDFMNKIKGTEE